MMTQDDDAGRNEVIDECRDDDERVIDVAADTWHSEHYCDVDEEPRHFFLFLFCY